MLNIIIGSPICIATRKRKIYCNSLTMYITYLQIYANMCLHCWYISFTISRRDRLTEARMLAFEPINTSIKQNHKSGKGTNDTPVDRYFFFLLEMTQRYIDRKKKYNKKDEKSSHQRKLNYKKLHCQTSELSIKDHSLWSTHR